MTTSSQRSRASIPTALPLTTSAREVADTDHLPHVLQNETWRVGVLPATGGALAFGQIRHGDGWVDLLRSTPPDSYGSVEDCANFVLLPWSNRVGQALLDFRGERYRLRVNADDGTAIHGTARDFPWEVEGAYRSGLTMTFDSRDFCGVNYPWPFSARLTYRLVGTRFTVTTMICNEHDEPIPVGFGHHPYFARTLSDPDDQAQLEAPFAEYFVLDRALPNGPPVPVEDRVDFRSLRGLGAQFVDDCLTARRPGAPIRIVYPRSGRAVAIGSDDVFTHAVVYVPQDKPFFAVEPVTNANDAFTLHERGIPRSGLVVLPPGEGLEGSFWLEVES